MINFNDINYAKNLPDCYSKNSDSNNYKILKIDCDTISQVKKDIVDTDAMLDLDKAYGFTLDLYGDMVGVARGSYDDDKYRYMIRAKIMRNLSGSDHNSVINAIANSFNCDISEIKIQDSNLPATVDVLSVPFDIIERTGLTQAEVTDTIKQLLPAGVGITTLLMVGTFEFAEGENAIDSNKGFANDSQTIGGYLGNIAS